MRILLVEDNPGDVGLIREALSERLASIELVVARDGLEAFEGLADPAVRPDLIVLDLNLPRLDGRELLMRVKADPELRRIPVVVLTSSNAPQDIDRAYELHANCYVVKPPDYFGVESVVQRIAEFWLETARLPGRCLHRAEA